MATRVRLDSAGVREVLRSPAVRAALVPYADRAASAAKASAPWADGDYAASIHRESTTTDRAVELVVADAPHAVYVEARTGNLARALGSVGG